MGNHDLQAAASALRAIALPDICRVEDLAEHIGLSELLIRDALQRGELPGRQLGGTWLISRQALLAWLSDTDREGQ